MLETTANTANLTVLDGNSTQLVASNGDDMLIAMAGDDTIIGMEGNDYINGNEGRDVIGGNQGKDTLRGGKDNDFVYGGDDIDLIFGDEGSDRLYGENGEDIIAGGNGDDAVFGGIGTDLLFGNRGRDSLFGGADSDTMRAGKEDDVLMGELGNDVMYGELGEDVLYGGEGSDTLSGGEGRDRFVLDDRYGSESIADADVVTDYEVNLDSLLLIGNIAFEQLEIFQGSGQFASDTIVRDTETNTILARLLNVSSNSIDRDKFEGAAPPPVVVEENPDEMPSDTVSGGDTPDMGSDSLPGSEDDPVSDPTSDPTVTEASIAFSSTTFNASEGDGTATITLARSGDISGETSVDYTTGDGTAIAGSDYTAASGTLTFAAGETVKTFTINITDDSDTESDETVQLTVTSVSGGALGEPTEATLTIADDDTVSLPGALPAAIDTGFVGFTPSDSEATIAATAAQRLTLGTQTIYIGTWQKTGINQDPIVASFDSANPSNNWIRTDYEMTGADGTGYGLFWNGSNLYAVFSTDGTQGSVSEDWRRASGSATQNWLKSYGAGGGAKIAVLGKIDPATGDLQSSAYISALLSSGNSNSLSFTNITTNASGNLVAQGRSFFNPRNPDGTAMTQVGSDPSPFDYTIEITPDLRTVVNTSAVGWV